MLGQPIRREIDMGAVHWAVGACVFLGVVAPGSVLAEVYRWTDSNGRVHFGDRPHSTDPKAVKEVAVPRPNLVEGFKGPPAATPSGPTDADAIGDNRTPAAPTPAAPAPKVNAPPKRGFAEQSKASCQAKVTAYRASKTCFDECGRQNGNMSGRNNAGCEHCVDLPMPNC
jgi:Domain of unknown function (DUF4124)